MREQLFAAYGVYVKQEPKQTDSWRDVTEGQLWSHLQHEIAEVKRSWELASNRYHNLLDLTGLAALNAAKVQLRLQEIWEKTVRKP